MNETRRTASSASPFESRIGFSRAVRDGRTIAVSGTAPLAPDGTTVGVGDPAAQARRCFEIIRDALHRVGADLTHVIRTRIFLKRIEDWEAVAIVHGEFFRDVRPASTIIQVTRFIDPAWLVEVEADAVDAETRYDDARGADRPVAGASRPGRGPRRPPNGRR